MEIYISAWVFIVDVINNQLKVNSYHSYLFFHWVLLCFFNCHGMGDKVLVRRSLSLKIPCAVFGA